MLHGNTGILIIDNSSKIHNGPSGLKQMEKLYSHCKSSEEVPMHPELKKYNHELLRGDYDKSSGNENILELISDTRFINMPKYTIMRRKNGEKYKLKKNAVILIEIKLFYMRPKENGTAEACPLDIDEQERKRWEEESLLWGVQRFQDPVSKKNNVIFAYVHYDAENPHIHMFICPEYDGRYDQNFFFGGPIKIDQLLKSYNKMMQEKFGLLPLEKKGKVKNSSVKRIRRKLDESVFSENPVKMMPEDTSKTIIARANETLKNISGYYFGLERAKEREIDKLNYQIKNPGVVESIEYDFINNRIAYLKKREASLQIQREEITNLCSDIYRILKDTKDPTEAKNEVLREIYSRPQLLKRLSESKNEIARIKLEINKNK